MLEVLFTIMCHKNNYTVLDNYVLEDNSFQGIKKDEEFIFAILLINLRSSNSISAIKNTHYRAHI